MEVTERKRDVVLMPQRRHFAESARHDWVMNAEEGTKVEDILKPSYWSLIAAELEPFDRVEVRLESGEWTADLIVKQSGRNWATVHLIAVHQLEQEVLPATPAEYEVLYKGPQLLHCIIRKSDSAVMQSALRTKAEALAWIDNFDKASRVT